MSEGSEDYEVVGSESIFRGRVISLRTDRVRMPDGEIAVREVVSHPGAVAIVALDEQHRVVLVNQYRHPVRARLDELPAGLLDVPGEPALQAAQRELAEEAALTADSWRVLVDLFSSPGMSNEAIRVYLARGLHEVPADQRHVPDAEEITLVSKRVPLADAVRRAYAGTITNGICVAGLLAALHAEATGWAGLRDADAPWPARPQR